MALSSHQVAINFSQHCKERGASQIIEFSLDSLGVPTLLGPLPPPPTGKLGAIQMGPDGQLYVAVAGSGTLGQIQVDEDEDDPSTYIPNASPGLLGGTTSTIGLPNFIQTIIDPIQGPGLSVSGVCIGDSTQFSASGKDSAIDKFDWTFGDGQVLVDGGPQLAHLYAAPGTYIVRVLYTIRANRIFFLTRPVIINNVPLDPTGVVTICDGTKLLDANPSNAPNLTYVWSTGDSTRTILPPRQGIYQGDSNERSRMFHRWSYPCRGQQTHRRFRYQSYYLPKYTGGTFGCSES